MRRLLHVTVVISLCAAAIWPVRLEAHHNDPVGVLDARQAAFNVHNLDAAMAFFADDAVVTVLVDTPRQAQYIGRAQIRRWQEALLNEQSIRVEAVGKRNVEGDKVTWIATVSRGEWQKMGVQSLQLWGEAVVQDGKIISLRNGLTPASAEKLRAAAARQNGQ